MSSLEDRIRAATRAAGDTVRPDSVPPLKLRTEQMTTASLDTGVPRLRRWSRLLAPVAAAVAVTGVVVAAVLVSGSVQHGTAARNNGSATPGTISTGSAADIARAGVPPFYVALNSRGNPVTNPVYAVVRATATGTLLGTIQPSVPGGDLKLGPEPAQLG